MCVQRAGRFVSSFKRQLGPIIWGQCPMLITPLSSQVLGRGGGQERAAPPLIGGW